MNENKVVFTLTAKCRDCYRCLKACPVKAINMKNEQAFVDESRCIYCATCIRECPQNAKIYRNDIDKIKKILKQKDKFKVLSLAPSLMAIFSKKESGKIISFTKSIGFDYVVETSIGAYPVAKATYDFFLKNNKLVLSTACPAFVNLVKKYYPEFVENLAPIVSPMVAHAMMIKEKYKNNSFFVFAGPCVTKKDEADNDIYSSLIDAVITFEELLELIEEREENINELKESNFDEKPIGYSRLFPLPGGLIKSAEIDNSIIEEKIIHISGIDEIKELLSDKSIKNYKALIEPLFCKGGCINGVAIKKDLNFLIKRSSLFKNDIELEKNREVIDIDLSKFKTRFKAEPVNKKEFTEQEIEEVLAKTGKSRPIDQLNCKSCGYESCRDKAIAVLEGRAHPEMCLPYMRRLAEQREDKIIETSPNGIIILNNKLEIIKANSSFMNLFRCKEVIGKNISLFLDPEPFEKLLAGEEKIELTNQHIKPDIICYEIFYTLKEEEQFVGIFVDLTKLKYEHKKLEKVKKETLENVRELMEYQIETAQKIAKFLGDNIAINEKVLKNLLSIKEKDDE